MKSIDCSSKYIGTIVKGEIIVISRAWLHTVQYIRDTVYLIHSLVNIPN